MPINQINSESLIQIESHFRVSAGPGAGKTFWLVNHIKNVIHNSKRLLRTRKIACITYTNIAVDTIVNRLGNASDFLVVGTIHSFLYNNVLKPYAYFLPSEYEVNIEKIDGHDDTILSNYSFLNEWKTRTNQQRIRDDKAVVKAFESIRWKFDNAGNLIVRPSYPMRADNYAISNASYYEYKKMAWSKGVIHHDDVLFLSYQLIILHPFILTVLRAKYPYFFIDEFQDTNPIQTKIIELIGQRETIVGIIGDKAQSIYGFQGACPEQFEGFNLNTIVDYQIRDNRRSTGAIVKFLNTIRTDLQQTNIRACEGNKPVMIIGPMSAGFEKFCELYTSKDTVSLSRKNDYSNTMRKKENVVITSNELLTQFYNSDKDDYRKRNVISSCRALEQAKEGNYEIAIKEMSRLFFSEKEKTRRKKKSLIAIEALLNNYSNISQGTVYELVSFLKQNINQEIVKVTRGNVKLFYENTTYINFIKCLKLDEDYSIHRTIHSAKGAEFDNVYLVLESESDLVFILEPNLTIEENRIFYVAASRAKDNFCINVPSLSTQASRIIQQKGFELINLN
jgi:DNA helicase-2/ATP-dependent DNA helicase PcrA